MVTKLYCYCKESFKTNKIDNNIEWLIKGYEKNHGIMKLKIFHGITN